MYLQGFPIDSCWFLLQNFPHSLHLDANTRELGKKWREWDEATINSYRLQFRAIDLNEDGLIDFKEL